MLWSQRRWLGSRRRGTINCYYRILGVDDGDSIEVVKSAYFALAKKHHPDTSATEDKTEAQRTFHRISEAYAFLSNPEKKRLYDRTLTSNHHHHSHNDDYDDDDSNFDNKQGGGSGLDDLISKVRQHIANQYREQVRPTLPVEVKLTVQLDQLMASEQSHEIEYQSYVQCTECRGAGTCKAACTECVRGKPECDCHKQCSACKGKARVYRFGKRTTVRLPFGTKHGDVLVMKHGGHWSKHNGVGDVHVRVHVPSHSLYERSATSRFDLLANVHVTLVDSLLGCTRTLGAGNIQVEVPINAKHGNVLRQPSLGLPKSPRGGRGDLLCQVKVDVPAVLSPRQIALLLAFQKEEVNKV